MKGNYIRWFDEIGIEDVGIVGGKNASLGEMTRNLKTKGIPVPFGYATTSLAYREFLEKNNLSAPITALLQQMKSGKISLSVAGKSIRDLILGGSFPGHIAGEISQCYTKLSAEYQAAETDVAVRSSATAEDLPDASFAGQQETYLNIRGDKKLLTACLQCYASLFTDRAISYRESKGFDHMKVYLSIGIQKMIRSDLAGAGVMFTIDTENGFPGNVTINAAWGLGESVVQGLVDPDEYRVFKALIGKADRPILQKTTGSKETKIIYTRDSAHSVKTQPTSIYERSAFVLKDSEIIDLSRWAMVIEQHYGKAMDIEWAKDGFTGKLYIVQARPETVQSRRDTGIFEKYRMLDKGRLLASGLAIGSKIVAGKACVVRDVKDLADFREGSILVATMTDPDWVPIMKKAAGIVTDHGGRTSHAAIISRELGIPAIIGCGNATSSIAQGEEITLSCAESNTGKIFAGKLNFAIASERIDHFADTRTKIMINMANPDTALDWWQLPADGIGLARMEFIISDRIKIHPMALVHPELVTDAEVVAQIAGLTQGFADQKDYFVEKLCSGICSIAASRFPNPVILRMSDFKTNEYANLVGGKYFEPAEENPMIGFRGASRYYSEAYREGFALECAAVKRARAECGFTNIHIMIPFLRTLAEADQVLAEVGRHGLHRGDEGLKFYMMCEIPSNAILADKFAEKFDGFSIGSNDLTQLTLGIDRDSDRLAYLFDERDLAVKELIRQTITKAHQAGITVGICGQAPSDYPEFCEFLIETGIDSISVDPERFIAVKKQAAEIEHRPKPA